MNFKQYKLHEFLDKHEWERLINFEGVEESIDICECGALSYNDYGAGYRSPIHEDMNRKFTRMDYFANEKQDRKFLKFWIPFRKARKRLYPNGRLC
jgi:hypothetical protein